jgi:hypothetical protein
MKMKKLTHTANECLLRKFLWILFSCQAVYVSKLCLKKEDDQTGGTKRIKICSVKLMNCIEKEELRVNLK